jgi:hypothetical protein
MQQSEMMIILSDSDKSLTYTFRRMTPWAWYVSREDLHDDSKLVSSEAKT